MKLAYILTNERPLSGLMQTQVISLLSEVKRQRPHYKITVIAVWQPWVYFRYSDRIKDMTQMLERLGLEFKSKPYCLLPFRHFMDTGVLLPILITYLKLAFLFLGLGRFDIVHARSYFGTIGATTAKKLGTFRLVFDMRSLLPEENVTIGKWALDSPVFNRWKAYEREAARIADAIVAVSAPMQREAAKIIPGKAVDLIPLIVNIERFKFDPIERERLRNDLGWTGCQILAYQGSLGLERQWNNVHNYAEYFSSLQKTSPGLKFVLVVEHYRPEFLTAFESRGIDANDLRFYEGTEHLVGILSAADVGIHVMSSGPDSATRLGVKVVEYLSCGLPVISNSNVGAAADLLEESGVGLRLDLNPGHEQVVAQFLNRLPTREKCREVAETYFSASKNASRYISMYERILR